MPKKSLSVALLLLCCSSLFAGMQRRVIDIPERAEESDKVIVGQVRKITPRWDTNAFGDKLIMSQVEFHVEETIEGTPESTVLMDIEGGTLDGMTMQSSLLPKMEIGERAVLFLDPPQKKKVRRPHLKGLGILKLDREDRVQRSSLSLQQIRQKSHEGRSRRRGNR